MADSSFLDASEFLSIGFGFAGLVMAAITVYHYWPKARAFLADPQSRNFSGWLSLGILVGFLCGGLDSAYWQLAWIADYTGMAMRDFLFKYGVVANIPFRNIALLFSAYCHYRAILTVLPKRRSSEALYVTISSLIFGFFLASLLLIFR